MTTRVYVSHVSSKQAAEFARAISELPDHLVLTTHDFDEIEDLIARSDARINCIVESDLFVLIGSAPGHRQQVRAIELGLAIGAEVPIAFIGSTVNPYCNFGDVFDDFSSFIEAWTERTKKATNVRTMRSVP